MISEADIERALNYLRDNAENDAQAHANMLYLDKWLDVVLAQEQAKAMASSVAAAKIVAECSDAYKAALDGYRESVFENKKRQFLRSAAETRIEAWRTMCSNERAQGKIG